MRRICFDLDGVICTQTSGDYENARPDSEAIAVINSLFQDGYHIIINTSRFMGRTKGDSAEAHKLGYEFTRRQLESWGVRYHELFLGKPACDVLVDDRAVFWVRDWAAIATQLRGAADNSKRSVSRDDASR